jgi:predicted alpha/beta-fold hydrolase
MLQNQKFPLQTNIVLEPCVPPIWAYSGHAQTIWGHLIPSPRSRLPLNLWKIELPDGDQLSARVHEGVKPSVILFFHGLGGSIDSDYMHRCLALTEKMEFTVVLINHRGCGEGFEEARHPYHSGRGEDVSEVVKAARLRWPGKQIITVGFSLSGSANLNLLEGMRGDCLPDAGIVVNAPVNLARTSEILKRGLNRIYDFRFSRQCQEDIKRKQNLGLIDKKIHIPFLSHLNYVDEVYTSGLSGFANANDYYQRCSTYQHFDKIKTPTIILTSTDDPFIHIEDYFGSKPSEHVLLHVEKVGGHMGYLNREKTPLGSIRWLDYALEKFLRFFTTQL